MKKRIVYIPKTGSEYQSVTKMFRETDEWEVIHEDDFTEHGIYVETAPTHVDLVCFTGGPDVSPWMYGEENIHSFCDENRDRLEQEIYEDFVGRVPMVGICRGGQFLNVMNGGKMIQHIDGHSMGHRRIHGFLEGGGSYVMIEDAHEDHHQGMIPYEGRHDFVIGLSDDDIPEILWYEHTKCLCFQPHPEWGHEPTRKLFFDLIQEYIGV